MSHAGNSSPLSIGQCATLACLWEASAPKPGNVNRGADFEDLSFHDFLTSAVLIAPAMEAAAERRLGQTVLAAIEATRRGLEKMGTGSERTRCSSSGTGAAEVPVPIFSRGTNTNLGTVLLLSPLAAVPRQEPLESGVREVLRRLVPEDARDVYRAIVLARPGGMGRVDQYDVSGPPPADLLAAMRAAAGRDMIARQYAEDFAQVLGLVVPRLRDGLARGWPLVEAIVYVQMQLLAQFPDSLIGRKCGPEIARAASARAGQVLDRGGPGDEAYYQALDDFDFWLRSDGHRRNPGTTADLIAAGLFCGLRDGWLAI